MYHLTKILVRFLYCLGIIILGTGCSTTHEFVSPDEFYEGNEARIILTDGETLNGYNIEIGVDSLSCLESDSKLVTCIPQSEVMEIETKNYGQGASDGVLLGTGTGIVLGVIVGAIIAGKSRNRMAGLAYLGGPLVGGVGGGVIGLIWGSAVGHTDRYIISSSRQNEFVQFKELPPDVITKGVLQRIDYVKIEISSIVNEDKQYITIIWKGQEIQLDRIHIKEIDTTEDKIYIKILKEEYLRKFK